MKLAKHIYLSIAIIALALGFIAPNAALDIQLHDTYYVISYLHIGILVAILCGLMAWFHVRFISTYWISVLQIVTSTLSFGFLLLCTFNVFLGFDPPRRHYRFDEFEVHSEDTPMILFAWLLLTFMVNVVWMVDMIRLRVRK